MSNLQYVGPRVVPKPYRNPDTGNAEWKSGIEYEALTMVTYLSNGYVSAKPVPSSVGNPEDNPDYWVESADFDAALSDLQTRVFNIENVELPSIRDDISDVNTRIDNLSDRNIIFIGDSYNDVGYMDWVNKLVAINPHIVNHYNGCIPGAAFLQRTDGTAGNGFLNDCLKSFDTLTTAEKASVTDIILCGGANDCLNSVSGSLQSAIADFVTYATTNYPNARVAIGFIARFKAGDGVRTMSKFNDAKYYYHNCVRNGKCAYITGIDGWVHNDSSQLLDHTHPDSACGSLLARALNDYLEHGATVNMYNNMQSNDGGITYNAIINGDSCELTIYGLPVPTLGATVGGYGKFTHMTYKLTTISHLYFNRDIYVPVNLYNGTHHYNAWLQFTKDEVYLGIENYDPDASNGDVTIASDFSWQLGTNATTITFNTYNLA